MLSLSPSTLVAFAHVLLFGRNVLAQQYAGDVIPNSMPSVPGSEFAYFRINDPAGANNQLTLMNYQNLLANGSRLDPNAVQRAVIVIHGLNQDPGTYMSNVSAMSQLESAIA